LVTVRGKGDKGVIERVDGGLEKVAGERLAGRFVVGERVLRGGASKGEEGGEKDVIGSQEGM
jgi:hypothetical protein